MYSALQWQQRHSSIFCTLVGKPCTHPLNKTNFYTKTWLFTVTFPAKCDFVRMPEFCFLYLAPSCRVASLLPLHIMFILCKTIPNLLFPLWSDLLPHLPFSFIFITFSTILTTIIPHCYSFAYLWIQLQFAVQEREAGDIYTVFAVADGRDSTPRQIRQSLKTTRQCSGPQWGATCCSSCTTRVPCLCSATSQQGRGSQDTGKTCHSHLYCSQHWLTPGTAPHIPRSCLSVIT